MSIEFLTVDEVVEIHELQITRFGGGRGLRDRGLLVSAVAQPAAAYDGRFLHDDLYEMAAAYLFHLVANHPFVDGNKRVGLATALVFLEINNAGIRHGTDALYEMTVAVAEGRLDTAGVTRKLREIAAFARG
jgi:death-on-curing protein